MRKYVKPIAVVNSNVAEGVYAASGCYTATAYIHQTIEGGRKHTYHIPVDGKHKADHTKNAQILTITFNQNVTYVSCNGQGASVVSGNGTPTLVIKLSYYQNPTDSIGLGDLEVTSDKGLSVTGVSISD